MSINEKQKALLTTVAKHNQIGRVSIWLFNDDRSSMTSEVIYSLKDDDFLPGLTISKKDFPVYFESIEDNSVIDANDAINDSRTKEFSEVYLKPLGITSMLDVPLKNGEKTIGVVCHEHIGEKREWTNDEKLFALSNANQIALVMGTDEKIKIENALLESEQRFALALNALPVIFWTTDRDLIVTACSGHGLERTNIRVDDIIGKPLIDLLGTDQNDISYNYHFKTLNGESCNFEYEFHGFLFQIFLEPLRDSTKTIIGCIGMAISIDDRKQAEEELREREQQLSSVFDTVADTILVIDVEGNNRFRFNSVNKAFQDTTGIPQDKVVGKLINDIIPQPSLDIVLGHYNTAIKEKRSVSWEETSDYPIGRLTGIVTIAPVFDDAGNCTKLVGSVKDITERKKIDDELRTSEERYQILSEVSYEGIAIHDMGVMLQVNHALAKMFGYTESELIGMNALRLATPDSVEIIKTNMILGTEEPYEAMGIKKDGTIFPVELQGRPMYYNGKKVRVAALRDITSRKKAEKELRESEEKFRLLAETTDIIPWESDAKTFQFTYVGPQAEHILGYPAEEWYSYDFWPNHIHPDDREEALSFCLRAFKTKKNYEFDYRMIASDGSIVWFHDVVTVQVADNVPVTLRGYLINITERKRIENELKENEGRFRKLVETSDIIPWEIDAKTFNCTYVGPQAEKILGFSVEEWYEPDFWTNHIHPEDQSRAAKYFIDEFQKNRNYDFEYRMIAKNGDVVWFHDLVTVERGPNNEPIKLRGYLIDITRRKLADEKVQEMTLELEQRVQERTAQLQANNIELQKAKITAEESKAAKELFLASMSHEIRTPLNAIIGFQQLLKSTSLNEEQQEYVESIDFAGKNLLVIINDILDLSKIEAGKFQFDELQFSVHDIAKSVIELVNHRAKEKNIKLYIYVDASIPQILFGDSARLSQILLNLVGNAIKFTDSGEVKISANCVSETDQDVLCEFVVEDTGIGIASERLPYIFERFTQESVETNRAYGGTGLGLTISKYLVELQGGKIWVTSEKGKGSVFTFQLKFKKQSAKSSFNYQQPEGENAPEKFRKLSILLAEDVLLNQRLVVKIMEKWGHDLEIAENGKVAVDKVKEKNYDLILMDIQMPVMDGYDAAKLIRSLPDLKKQATPIIALTAHASNAEAEKCINLGMNAYLAKPFNQQNLLQVINQLVNQNH